MFPVGYGPEIVPIDVVADADGRKHPPTRKRRPPMAAVDFARDRRRTTAPEERRHTLRAL
jgi:hypothetical protein